MATTTTREPGLIHPGLLKRPPATRQEPAPAPQVDVRGLWAELRRTVEGEVRFDRGAQALYATDASNYRQVPIGVCIPRSAEDAIAIVAACRAFGAPIVSRAGGTGLAGQTCNAAVVIDWSKYVNRIVEVDPKRRLARVQPGVICDQLADAVKRFGLTYGPKPATHDHCCFGGMLSNNSCGVHAQMAGKALENTEAMDVLLYDGTQMSLGWTTDAEVDVLIRAGGRHSEIHTKLRALRERYGRLVQERFPKIPRRVSGYNLDQLLPGADGRFNLARALVGTEGTCVTMLEMKVRLVYNPPERVLVVLGYPDIYRAADHLMDVLAFTPIGLEGMDGRLRDFVAQKHTPGARYLPLLPNGDGWLFVEFGGDTKQEVLDQAQRLIDRLQAADDPPSYRIVSDPAVQAHLWKVRESGLGATAFVPGMRDTWPGWEDSAVAPERTGDYLRDLRVLFERFGYQPSVYGHFGMGCVHCRIDFDLISAPGVAKYRRFMDEAADLVIRHGGSLSGEHGDGQSRAELWPKMFGPELVSAFREFKSIWDPDFKMNPGKLIDPYRIDENLRLGPHYKPWEPKTHFRYPEDDGSFAHATLRCVGIGKCRRLGGEGQDDTMCPSFMVLREEKHTTRGRAHLLFEMTQKGPIQDGWRDENVKESLELCLSCKGCKGDCPVGVDVATYKSEFLSHYYEGRLRPRSAYAFGLIDKWARAASMAPGFANLFTQLPGLRAVTKSAMGVPQAREIPAFAPETFRTWFHRRPIQNAGAEKVILWADTFNNYFLPETAQAAVEVLEHAGFQVDVPRGHFCCGRPLYDYGMLDRAKRYLNKTLHALKKPIEARTPIVVLEPSCCSVFRDELPNLMPEHGPAKKLAEQVFTLSEFLTTPRVRATGYIPPRFPREVLAQGHCHHKSIMRFDAEEKLIGQMGIKLDLLSSGCCGMAGGFGYEKGAKYEVSVAAGERVLLPAVRAKDPSAVIMADGFSCKEQIAQGTERGALHLAQLMKVAIDEGPDAPHTPFPERPILDARRRAQRRSMVRAGLVTAALLLGMSAAVMVFARRR